MKRDELLALDDVKLGERCALEFFKATGNGGQKRNKTSSAVRVRLLEDPRFWAEDCTERSQHRNRACALRKLRYRLALELREAAADETLPETLAVSSKNPDYFLFLARIFDCLAEYEYDYRPAADRLGTSRSALLKKLADDPEAWTALNRGRDNCGLPRWKC